VREWWSVDRTATAPRLRAYRIVLEWDDEDPENAGWVAMVPALPGCVTQGDTLREVLDNVQDAIALYLESLVEDGKPIPPADADGPVVVVQEP
jgi:antitoxin HicB